MYCTQRGALGPHSESLSDMQARGRGLSRRTQEQSAFERHQGTPASAPAVAVHLQEPSWPSKQTGNTTIKTPSARRLAYTKLHTRDWASSLGPSTSAGCRERTSQCVGTGGEPYPSPLRHRRTPSSTASTCRATCTPASPRRGYGGCVHG